PAWRDIAPDDLSAGCVGFMGGASSLGLGLALARPERRVFVFDGDGSLLMQLGSLATIAGARPRNLVHLLFKNGVYHTSGAQEIPGGLTVDFVTMARGASLGKTPTYDEPAHIGAGLSYLVTGEFKLNPEHPPLLKELAALPLVAIGVRWPVSPAAWAALSPAAAFGFQWQLGNTVLVGDAPGRVLFWARLPMLLIALLLGCVLWAWGRRMLGDAAAVGALVLFALDPALIAHGPLVTTDVGCAAFVTLFVFALSRYLQRRTPGRLLLCG